MALDYRKCAEEIFSHLGGKENIISAAHCATRLRLVIADNSKIDIKALEEVEGVKGLFDSNGQLQLIIGTGVCMENGSPALKKMSDLVCPSVENDGLAWAFRELGLVESDKN